MRYDGPSTNNVRTESEHGLVYLDTSALVKIVIDEEESAALRSWYAERRERLSSVVTGVELRRAARRVLPMTSRGRSDLERETEVLLNGLQLLELDAEVATRAARLEPPALRSLDAIQLATALSLDELDYFVTYDERLAEAARAAGLAVASPGR